MNIIAPIHPTPRPTAFPAYYLGRPADMYRRRYRRNTTQVRSHS